MRHPEVNVNTVRTFFLTMVLAGLLAGCQGRNNVNAAAIQSLMRVDNAFSTLSAKQGFAAAFRQYAADDALLLPENGAALRGKATIEQSLQGIPAGATLSWTPQSADVSGALGYTWGIYALTGADAAGQKTVTYGKYLSIWKKPSGDWKLAVMMVNQSPGPAGG